METVTLILTLEVTTDINLIDSSGVTAGAIAGVIEAVIAVAMME